MCERHLLKETGENEKVEAAAIYLFYLTGIGISRILIQASHEVLLVNIAVIGRLGGKGVVRKALESLGRFIGLDLVRVHCFHQTWHLQHQRPYELQGYPFQKQILESEWKQIHLKGYQHHLNRKK